MNGEERVKSKAPARIALIIVIIAIIAVAIFLIVQANNSGGTDENTNQEITHNESEIIDDNDKSNQILDEESNKDTNDTILPDPEIIIDTSVGPKN